MRAKISEITELKGEKALIHSFNENFIYGLRLGDIDLGERTQVYFGNSVKHGVLSVEDFFKSDATSTGIKVENIFKQASSIPIVQRQEIKSQIYTNNLVIDFTNPLLEGTFNTFIVENTFNTKRSVLYRNMINANMDSHFVYFSPRREHNDTFAGLAKETGNINRCSIFSIKRDNKSELLFITKLLPHYLNYLRDNGKKIVLIIEDIEVLFMELYGIFNNTSSDIVYTFVRELQVLCCNSKQGSISTICFKGSNSNVDVQFQRMIDNFNIELALLSTTVVDSADKTSKKNVKSALAGFNFKPIRTKAFSNLQSYLSNRLYDLLLKVN